MWASIATFFSALRGKARITFGQLQALYALTLVLSFQAFIPTYANSTFLETIVDRDTVGVIFSIAAVISLLTLTSLSRTLTRIGVFNASLIFIIFEAVALFVLSTSSSPLAIAGAFIFHLSLIKLLFFALDVFVSSLSAPERIGRIRATILTMLNIAVALAPTIASFVVSPGNEFQRMYLLSLALLVPVAIILISFFRNFKDPVYPVPNTRKTLATVLRDKNLFNIFLVQLLLRFFYVWMVIYMPIYLIENMGFDWTVLGPMFTVMLLPFIIFELPIGAVADKYLGEQEMLVGGFIIMAAATFTLSIIDVPNIALWTAVLFITRVGACMVEVLSESYFFKQIPSSDTQTISLFRMLNPLAFVISPALATLILLFIDVRLTFIVVGAIMLSGVIYSLRIVDTK